MDHEERIRRLKRMLEQVTEGAPPAIEAAAAGLETMHAPGAIPAWIDEELAAAQRGWEKMAQGREDEVDPREAFGLEAIILPRERPVYFIEDGDYPQLPDPWTELNDAAKRQSLRQAIAGIGRIELPTQPLIPYGGTGFLVGGGLLMTNRHVAQLFARGLGTRDLLFTSGDAGVDFRRERNSPEKDRSQYFDVTGVAMVHPYWDMALLRVRGLEGIKPLTLSVDEPADGGAIVAIGYPARDDRSNLAEQDRIFERVYNVKRFQPGRMRARERVLSFQHEVDAATHDSSTLGGNSGSAIVDPKSGNVVALHFAGVYLKANYGVPALELARDPRVVDAGVNFAGRLPPSHLWDDAWRRVSPSEVPSMSPAPAAVPATTTFTIPLHVTVSLGAPAGPATPATMPPAATEAVRIPIIFDGLEDRGGFDQDFLQIANTPVPMPTLTERGKKVAATLEDGSHELKYHKFSVVIHKRRRLALFTASNVDWREASRKLKGRKPTRKELTGLGDGDIEKWVTDDRIPDEHQLPDVFYTRDGGAFDKGHLVRRDDVAWGKDLRDMQMANGDTYHTTNCSPQVSSFNQSARGVDNWGDLENMVQKQTKAETAVVFSGPVLADDDPLFDGRGDGGATIVLRVPRRFWKIVVAAGDKGPQAFGFVLHQDLSAVPTQEEMIVPPEWRRYLCSIDEIEGMLFGLAKLGSLGKWDQYGKDDGEAVRAML